MGVTAAAGLAAVVITNYLNGKREDERSAIARRTAQEQLEREDRLREEQHEREDRTRFLDQRRDLYVRTMVAVNAVSQGIHVLNAQVGLLTEWPSLAPAQLDSCRAELDQLSDQLDEVLAEVELLGPMEVRHAGAQLEVVNHRIKLELARTSAASINPPEGLSEDLRRVSWEPLGLELAVKMSFLRDVVQRDLGLS